MPSHAPHAIGYLVSLTVQPAAVATRRTYRCVARFPARDGAGSERSRLSYLHLVGLQLVRLHVAASAEIQVPSAGSPKSCRYMSSVSP